jgi:hypothetical protein
LNIKPLKLILIYLAASILLLHSIIPHKHLNDLDNGARSETYAEADGVVDYIKLMFLTDLGEGHMETFDQGKEINLNVDFQFDFTPDIAVLANKLSFVSLSNDNYTKRTNCTYNVPILRRDFLSNIDFRGPPTVS